MCTDWIVGHTALTSHLESHADDQFDMVNKTGKKMGIVQYIKLKLVFTSYLIVKSAGNKIK